MSVLHPGLLAAGLAAIALPILIHILFRRRRRPVRWGAMRFVIEAYRRQRRKLRFEQWLLLAARCLLIGLVGVALARPMWGAGRLATSGPVDVYVLIDDSLTASAEPDDADSALDRHKSLAKVILDELDSARGDRAGLVSLASPPGARVLPASPDLDAVSSTLDRLRPTHAAIDLEGTLTRLRAELESEDFESARTIRVVILSDFLGGSAPVEQSLPPFEGDERVEVFATRPLETGVDNVSVLALRPLRSMIVGGSSTPAEVTLRRSGPGAQSASVSRVRVRLVSGDRDVIVGDATVEWGPGRREAIAPLSLAFEIAEQREAAVHLDASVDVDAISGDNTFRTPIRVRETLRVGIVAPRWSTRRSPEDPLRPADWISLALAPSDDPNRETVTHGDVEVNRLDPSALDGPRLASLDAVFVVRPDLVEAPAWRRLGRFATAGGLVLVTPPDDSSGGDWAQRFADAFGLGWSIEPEPVEAPEDGLAVAPERDGLDPSLDLLSVIASELPDLTGVANVRRVVEVGLAADDRTQRLLSLEDGRPLLLAAVPRGPTSGSSVDAPDSTEAASGGGLVVLITTAIAFDWTDLPARPLFVPLMQELVRQGVGVARASGAQIAGQTIVAPAGAVELRSLDDEEPAGVRTNSLGVASAPMRRAGAWRGVDERGATVGLVTVNADPRAGVTDPVALSEVQRWLDQIVPEGGVRWLDDPGAASGGTGGVEASVVGASSGTGAEFASKLLLIALLVAVIELILSKLFTHGAAARETAQ